MSMLSIDRRTVTAQPTLFVRYTTSMAQLSLRIGEGLGKTHRAVTAQGLAVAGRPFVRYLSVDQSMTIEVGMPVANGGQPDGDVESGELPGGIVAVAVHAGAYDTLRETYRAMERWAAEQGARFGGAPWESYVTDPGANPDRATWRTEIYWPLTS